MGYEKDTKLAYMNHSRAEEYKRHHTEDFSWARLTMWRERLCVERALRLCSLNRNSRILDIPCGTGILAGVLSKLPSSVIASDISREMIDIAIGDYSHKSIVGVVQSDIAKTPFRKAAFACVITLGLMHRLPKGIRKEVLSEVAYLSNKFIIISYSSDSPYQRMKHWLIKKIWLNYKSAPSPVPFQDIMEEFNSHRLTIKKAFRVVYFLSAEVVFLLEKE